MSCMLTVRVCLSTIYRFLVEIYGNHLADLKKKNVAVSTMTIFIVLYCRLVMSVLSLAPSESGTVQLTGIRYLCVLNKKKNTNKDDVFSNKVY